MCRLLFFRVPEKARQGTEVVGKYPFCLNIPLFGQMLSERSVFSKKVFD